VHLYTFKFGEYFTQYADFFFGKIWEMIIAGKAAPSKQNEKLIYAIIRYLTELSSGSKYAEFFKTNMQGIFLSIVIPNISLT